MIAPDLEATVAICTRDRADSLARTLDSLRAAADGVTAPWELLIVNNGGSDHTPDIVRRYEDCLPIRMIDEPQAGLSNARNAATRAARGRVIVWTDDDLLVDRGWLAAYLDAFRRWPDHAIFGGRAVPRYEHPSPAWFRAAEADLASLLAVRDAPDWEEITQDRVPYGLNYAVRADVQRAHPYDPALGVAPGRRLGGEETTMIRAALADGARGRWVWDATVYHLIPEGRQTAAYVFSYYRAHGFRFPDLPVGTRPGPLTLLRFAGRFVRKGVMTLWRRARGRHAWVKSYISLARAVGTLDRLRGRTRPG